MSDIYRHMSLAYWNTCPNMPSPSWVWWVLGRIPHEIVLTMYPMYPLFLAQTWPPKRHLSHLVSHMDRLRGGHCPSTLLVWYTNVSSILYIQPPFLLTTVFCHQSVGNLCPLQLAIYLKPFCQTRQKLVWRQRLYQAIKLYSSYSFSSGASPAPSITLYLCSVHWWSP